MSTPDSDADGSVEVSLDDQAWFDSTEFRNRARALADLTPSRAVTEDCMVATGRVPPRRGETRLLACQRVALELQKLEERVERGRAIRDAALDGGDPKRLIPVELVIARDPLAHLQVSVREFFSALASTTTSTVAELAAGPEPMSPRLVAAEMQLRAAAATPASAKLPNWQERVLAATVDARPRPSRLRRARRIVAVGWPFAMLGALVAWIIILAVMMLGGCQPVGDTAPDAGVSSVDQEGLYCPGHPPCQTEACIAYTDFTGIHELCNTIDNCDAICGDTFPLAYCPPLTDADDWGCESYCTGVGYTGLAWMRCHATCISALRYTCIEGYPL